MSVPEDPDAWRQRAACREHDPDLWFPSPNDTRTRDTALRICHGCPVVGECRAEATRVRATYGVWAGAFIDQLGAFHTGAGRRHRPCGTLAAYRRHLRNGEKLCGACKDAAREAYLQRYRKSVERRANR